MKKIIIPFLIVLTLIFQSCEETQSPIYDGSQTLVYFSKTSANLEVLLNSTATIDIGVAASTLSQSDRTVTVSIDEDNTNALPSQYSFNGNVTIPANSYFGSATLTGIDSQLSTTGVAIRLIIEDSDFAVKSSLNMDVVMRKICPVPDTDFVGEYLIEQITPLIDGPTLSDGTIVTITADGTSRTFNTANYPDYCSTLRPFTFNLVCNEIVIPIQNSGCACGDGTDWFGTPVDGINSTYDPDDDSVFILKFGDDLQANCGPPAPVTTAYRFTKQ